MLTYNDLYEYARKERYSKQLQKLPKNFMKNVAEYLNEKKQIASKEENLFSEVIIKTKKQLENATTLIKEIILKRKKKILNLVLIAAETGISKQDFENMLDFEKKLFEDLMSCMEKMDKTVSNLLNGKEEEIKKNELVVFKEDIDTLIGFDGNEIGPFFKGQIANIPKDIAKILIEDDKAEIIEE